MLSSHILLPVLGTTTTFYVFHFVRSFCDNEWKKKQKKQQQQEQHIHTQNRYKWEKGWSGEDKEYSESHFSLSALLAFRSFFFFNEKVQVSEKERGWVQKKRRSKKRTYCSTRTNMCVWEVERSAQRRHANTKGTNWRMGGRAEQSEWLCMWKEMEYEHDRLNNFMHLTL